MSGNFTVDFVARGATDDEWRMVLLEQGPWQRPFDAHFRRLQSRLYDCLDAAIDGQLAERFPQSRGCRVVIQVDAYQLPAQELADFFARFTAGALATEPYRQAMLSNNFVAGLDFRLITESRVMIEVAAEVSRLLPTLVDQTTSQNALSALLSEIDPRLRWEIGPSGNDGMYLAFSPNYCTELLPLTDRLAASMPPHDGWIFLNAKPRKLWAKRSVIYAGREFTFDDWSYRLTKFKGGEFFDVDFFGCPVDVSEDTRDWLAVFLASSELGERLFMNAIDRVSASPKAGAMDPVTGIEHLFEHVSQHWSGR
jgi:hypothetical protein